MSLVTFVSASTMRTPVWGSTNQFSTVSTLRAPLHLKYTFRAWAARQWRTAGRFFTTNAFWGSARKIGRSVLRRRDSSCSGVGLVVEASSSRAPSEKDNKNFRKFLITVKTKVGTFTIDRKNISHPLYSPDLTSSDYRLFSKVK